MQFSTTVLKNSVLIVDDNLTALEEMSEALEEHGLAVYTAGNVDMALKLAKEHRPEFIMMDYFLDGYTGTEAVKDILKFLPEVQVIMISAFDDLVRHIASVDSSVIAVMKKPLPMDRIGRFISNFDDKKRQSRVIKK